MFIQISIIYKLVFSHCFRIYYNVFISKEFNIIRFIIINSLLDAFL